MANTGKMKAKVAYTVREATAPGETGPRTVPVIVARAANVSLARLIEDAIDRNLIAGLKPSAAEGIAEGIATQLYREFCDGNGVRFGQYFYGRPYLQGTVGANGNLTKERNSITVRLYKGEDFRLTLDDFSFTFEGADGQPRLQYLIGSRDGSARGELVQHADVLGQGQRICLDGDTLALVFEGGGGAVVVTEFTNVGPDQLKCAWPAGLVPGKAYKAHLVRTSEDGTVRKSNTVNVTVRAGEAPPAPSTPTLTEAYTTEHTEETDKDKAYGDGDLEVQGTNLTGATVKLQFEGVSGQPYEETVPAEKLDIRSDGNGFTIDGTWLTSNVLVNMSEDDTFLMLATTEAGNAELTVTNKYTS